MKELEGKFPESEFIREMNKEIHRNKLDKYIQKIPPFLQKQFHLTSVK